MFTRSTRLVLPALAAGALTAGIAAPVAADGQDARFLLRTANAGGPADLSFTYGAVDDTAVVGDFNGDGTQTVGVRRGNRYFIRNSNTSGPADLDFHFGRPDDTPVIGDFNGDGVDTVGVRRGRTFHLRFANAGGPADLSFTYGRADDITLMGDWNGDGTTTVGVHRVPQPPPQQEPEPEPRPENPWPDVPGTPPADAQVWVDLAECESNNDWQAVSANGLYYGGLQFHPDTWRSVGGSGLPNQASRAEQIHRAQLLLSQPWATWGNQWPACSRLLGLS